MRTAPPDGGWGWAVLAGVMAVNIVVLGHCKSFGVYFARIMEDFNATPSQVAWVQALQISAFSFSSPVASICAQKCGPRQVAMFGGILACLGLAASSAVPSIAWIKITYGLVEGIASGLVFTAGVMMIGQYFDQRRGLANGLGMAGNSVGGIVIPLVADALMNEYGLRGALLIMGGILLNGCVGIMLWQPVEWHLDPESDTELTDNKSSSLVASYSVDFLPSIKEYDQRRSSLTFSFQSSSSIPELSKPKDFETISKASSFMYLSTYHVGPSSSALLTKDHIKLPEEKEEEAESMIDSKSNRSEKDSIVTATPCCRPRCRISKIIDTSFFSDAAFYVLTFSMMCHYFSYPGTQMFLPLRATSLGLSQAQGASLLSALAFADLIGRIGCAWISDFHFFPRKYWFIAGILIAGVFAMCLQFPKSYALLLACSAGFGLASGAYIGLMIALFADTFGGDRVAVAYSLANMTSGFVTISGPPVMGYILESSGYSMCQIILGSVQILGASIWVLEPWAVGRQKARRELSAARKA